MNRSLILSSAARFLLPLLLLFSVFLLLRGHNDPGGGFAGGLVAAAAFTLYGMGTDPRSAREVLRIHPRTLIGAGLLVALASGGIGALSGQPFLTGLWGYLVMPGGTRVELGTPLFFDIGVYLIVLGVSLTIILTLAEE